MCAPVSLEWLIDNLQPTAWNLPLRGFFIRHHPLKAIKPRWWQNFYLI